MFSEIIEQTLNFKCGKVIPMYEAEYDWKDESYFWCNQCQVGGIRDGFEILYHNASADHEKNCMENDFYKEDFFKKKFYEDSNCKSFVIRILC